MKKKSEKLVWAIGDNGAELVPESETVEIKVAYQVKHPSFPDSSPVVPRSIRSWTRHGDNTGDPVELLEVEPAGQRMRNKGFLTPWPRIRYRQRDGKESSCFIRHEGDARDVLFAHLSQTDRDRIFAAVCVKQ